MQVYRRNITFNNVNSLTGFGVVINSEKTILPDPEQRYTYDTVPFHDGVYNSSAVNGKTFYEPITLTYVFVLHASSRAAVQALRKQIINAWSGAVGNLTDSDMPGWKYTNAMLIGEPRLEYYSRNFTNAELTLTFTADPYMQNVTGTRQRLTTWAAQGNTARAVIDNAAVYPLTWLEIPATPINYVLTFSINSTAEQSSLRSFYIFGIPSGVTVSDIYVVRQETVIRDLVTMTAPDRGTLGSVEANDMVVITYTDDITAAVAVGGINSGTAYSVANPRYRLDALTESTATLKINGSTQSIAQPFTLPATALLAITTSGYGYYELWHDDTEVRL